MPVLRFCGFTCFQFWSNTLTKRCTNNSLLHVIKFLPCLNWLVTCFDFRICFRKVNASDFYKKTYAKRCASNYLISRVNRLLPLHFAVDQALSIWKTEECRVSKNIALKTWRWKSRFWFCFAFVYFADLKTIHFVSCLYSSCKLF